MFSAHGLDVVVGAEHHAGLLAGLGGGLLSLDIWVDEDDAEEATALLADLRVRDDRGDPDASDDDHDVVADPGSPEDDEPASALQHRIESRRRTGVVLLLGCFVSFGTAHMFARAWARGVALAALEIIGFIQIGAGHALGGVAVGAAILGDLAGALWRVRAAPGSALPLARVHDG